MTAAFMGIGATLALLFVSVGFSWWGLLTFPVGMVAVWTFVSLVFEWSTRPTVTGDANG